MKESKGYSDARAENAAVESTVERLVGLLLECYHAGYAMGADHVREDHGEARQYEHVAWDSDYARKRVETIYYSTHNDRPDARREKGSK